MEKVMDKQAVIKVGTYLGFKLASLVTAYPDNNFNDEVKELLKHKELISFGEETGGETWKSLNKMLKQIIKGKINLDDLRSDYIDIFDRAKSHNSLYETEYGKERVMAKTNELADLSGFYQAFGLNSDSEEVIHDMADHISVELEFYSYLLLKQMFLEENNITEGVEVVTEGRKKFLYSHLGRFAKSITKRPGVINNQFFSTIFNWVDTLVYNECDHLEVTPIIIDWFANQVDDGAVDCALAGCGLAKK